MAQNGQQRVTIAGGIIHELREFGSNTTAHAIPRVVEAEKRPIRIMWAVIFALAAVIFTYHLYTLTSYYLTFPISTRISYKAVAFKFPDVTICNLLPFSLRKLELKDPGLKRFSELNSENSEHFDEQLEELLEGTEIDKYSMILSCTYNMDPCGPENFTVVADPIFRSCFTFRPQQEIMANTPEYGLNLLLYAENAHPHDLPDFRFAIHDNWESSGIRLIIHENNTRPYPELRGVNVQPGVSARFGVSMEQFKLYNIFRGGAMRCDDDERMVEHCDVDSMERGRSYKEVAEDCYTEVIQSMMQERCKCFSHEYAVPRSYCETKPINSSTDFCDPDVNDCYVQLNRLLKTKFEDIVVRQCVLTCNQLVYKQELSSSTWPSHVAEAQVLANIRKIYDNLTLYGITTTLDEVVESNESTVEDYGLLSNNFLRLSVYALSMTGDDIEEELAYPLPNYIGEIGGILGLWLGGSMLTFIEPIELLANIILIVRMVKGVKRRASVPGDLEATVQLQESFNGQSAQDRFGVPRKSSVAYDPYCPPKPPKIDPYC